MIASDQSDSTEMDARAVAAGFALVVVLTVLSALWGAFLVPFRVGAAPVPVSWVIALVGNSVLGVAAGRLGGRAAIVVAAGLWLAVALALGVRRQEGDLVVTSSAVGLGFLVLGAVGSAVAFGMHRPRRH